MAIFHGFLLVYIDNKFHRSELNPLKRLNETQTHTMYNSHICKIWTFRFDGEMFFFEHDVMFSIFILSQKCWWLSHEFLQFRINIFSSIIKLLYFDRCVISLNFQIDTAQISEQNQVAPTEIY